MIRTRVFLLLALTLGGAAQAESLQNALARLGQTPALQAAQGQVQVAEARLRAAGEIYNVRVKAGYVSNGYEDLLLSGNALQVGADISLKPIQFGDNADALELARIDAQRSLLDLRQTFTTLGIQAYRLTYQLAAAQQGQAFTLKLETIARASLDAVRLRLGQGQVSAAQARSAEATYRDVQEQERSAPENLSLLRAALTDLLGTSDVQAGVPVRLQPSASPDSVQAALGVKLAALQLRAAERNLEPLGNIGYTRTFGGQGSVGLSLDSRNLAPNLSLSYATAPLTTALPPVRSSVSLGLTFDVSPALRSTRTAAQAGLVAAQASLTAQQRADALRVAALNTALDQAERTLALRQQASSDAQQSLSEAQGRPVATLEAVTEAARAESALRRASLERLNALLDLYRFANQPVTEATRDQGDFVN